MIETFAFLILAVAYLLSIKFSYDVGFEAGKYDCLDEITTDYYVIPVDGG